MLLNLVASLEISFSDYSRGSKYDIHQASAAQARSNNYYSLQFMETTVNNVKRVLL